MVIYDRQRHLSEMMICFDESKWGSLLFEIDSIVIDPRRNSTHDDFAIRSPWTSCPVEICRSDWALIVVISVDGDVRLFVCLETHTQAFVCIMAEECQKRKGKSDYRLLFDCRLTVDCWSLINRWLSTCHPEDKHRQRNDSREEYRNQCEVIAIRERKDETGVKRAIASITLLKNGFDFARSSIFIISTSVRRQGVTVDFLELVPPHPLIHAFFFFFSSFLSFFLSLSRCTSPPPNDISRWTFHSRCV